MYNTLKLSTAIQSQLIKNLRPDSTIKELLDCIVCRVAEELQASAASIFMIDPSGGTATQLAGFGYQKQFIDLGQVDVLPISEVLDSPANDTTKLGLTGWILSKGQSFLARNPEELHHHPHYSGKHDPEMLPGARLILETFLGVPMRGTRGEVIGVIKAERRSNGEGAAKSFDINDQILLETVGRVASKCVVYQKMAVAGEMDAALTAWTREVINEAAATEGELDSFLDIVVAVMASVMRADSCAIYLADPQRKTLTQRAGSGSQILRNVIRSYILPTLDEVQNSKEGVGLTAFIAATGETVYARDYNELHRHPHHRGGYDKWNFPNNTNTKCGAFLGAPLRVGGTITGVIKVENTSTIGVPDPRYFPDEARQRFQALNQDVALAITRIQEQGPTRYQVIRDAKPTIVEILRGGLDVPSLVNKVVSAISELFNARACALFLRDGNYLIQPEWAAHGWAKLGPKVRIYELKTITDKSPKNRKDRVGLTVWIAVNQKPFIARSNLELTQHPHHLGHYDDFNFTGDQKCESFMGAPLMVGDKLVGVLKVETKMRKTGAEEETTYFNELDELVFDLIAQTAAIAIENARLLEAERLADQINRQQLNLLSILHDFGRDRWHSISILTQTAERLRAHRAAIAQMIDQYAALFKHDFDPQNLKNLPELIGKHADFLEDGTAATILFTAMSEALEVKSIKEIAECSTSRTLTATPRLMEPTFFMAEAAQFFVTLQSHISQALSARYDHPQYGQSLYVLTEMQKKAEALQRPEAQIFARIIDQWIRVVRAVPAPLPVAVENPYVTGAAVAANSPFFGRQDIFQWVTVNIHGAEQNNVMVLFGQRRVGKSSILVQLARGKYGYDLRMDPAFPLVPIHIDMQGIGAQSDRDFLIDIVNKISEGMLGHPRLGKAPEVPDTKDFDRNAFNAFSQFMDSLGALMTPGMVLLMFDEFEVLDRKVSEGHFSVGVFGLLRHQMQYNPSVGFILAGSRLLEGTSKEYIGLISTFTLQKEVSYLDKQDANDLVCVPLKDKVFFEEAAVEELVYVTNGHPLLLQTFCHEVIHQMNLHNYTNFISLEDANKVINKQAHNSTLCLFIMNELDKAEKDLITEIANRNEEGQQWVPESRVRAQVQPNHSDQQITDSLQHLITRRLIERTSSPAGESGYRVTIPFLSRWIYFLSH
jgi:GAF domain-containing protein